MVREISDSEAFALCDSDHRLNRYALKGEIIGLSRPLVLREAAVLFLSGADHLGSALKRQCSLILPETAAEPIVRGEELSRCVRFAQNSLEQKKKTGLLALYGAGGSGRRFCLSRIAKETKRSVLGVDCEELSALPMAERRDIVEEAIAYCMLQGAIPALLHFDFTGFSEAERTALAQELLSSFCGQLPFMALCGEKALRLRIGDGLRFFATSLKRHIAEQRESAGVSKSCRLPLSAEAEACFLQPAFR